MRLRSKLQKQRTTKTVDIIRPKYDSGTGTYSDVTLYTNLIAIWQQQVKEDVSDDWGRTTRTVDIFRFERLKSTGALPNILPDYVINEIATGNRYKILNVANLSGMNDWLRVEAEIFAVPAGD